MKVGELIEALKDIDPEREVIMSSDTEGNNYSPLSGWWDGIYMPDTTWSGEARIEGPLTDELRA